MCTEYYMSPAACEIMNIWSTKNSMITDDYRWLQSMITITSSFGESVITITIMITQKM